MILIFIHAGNTRCALCYQPYQRKRELVIHYDISFGGKGKGTPWWKHVSRALRLFVQLCLDTRVFGDKIVFYVSHYNITAVHRL